MNEYKKHFEKTRKAAEKGQVRSQSRELAELLRGQVAKRHKERRKSARMPMGMILFLAIGMVAGYFGLHYASDIEKFVKNIEVSWLGIAVAEETAKAESAPTAKAEKKEATAEVKSDKREFTEEEINHFARMNERKRELDAREEELNKMEAELITQKMALEKRINDLDQTRRNIASVLDDRVKADDKKIDSLVQLYSNMKPQQAAKVFETMDEDLAIEILGRMKKKPAAEILNLVKADKAQVLSEKYAGYKRK